MKKQRIYILALCCLLICSLGACGRDKNGNNNNSVTDRTQNYSTATPSPTLAPTTVPNNIGDGILDGVEDAGDGIINGTKDVLDGVGNAVDDIGNGMTGNDTENTVPNGNGTNGQ